MNGAPPSDTNSVVQKLLDERLRELPPWRKFEMVTELIHAAETMALAGLRDRHPNASSRELQVRLAALTLPRELMIAALDWDPLEKGY